MTSILRKIVLAPVVMAAVALASQTAKAEATLKVPFSFSVAGKTLPAGLYTVDRGVGHNLVVLKSRSTANSFSWVIAPGDPAPTDTRVILTFESDGQKYNLHTVQYGSQVTSPLDKAPKHSEHRQTQIIAGQ